MTTPATTSTVLDAADSKKFPQSVRFGEEEAMVREMMKSGLSFADVVRLSVKYAAPKFLSGEVNIVTFKARDKDERRMKREARVARLAIAKARATV